MFWLLMFVFSGLTYLGVNAIAGGFFLFGVAVILAIVVMGANYVNDFTGVNQFLNESYQWIVGVDNPDQMLSDASGQTCAGPDLDPLVAIFVVVFLIFVCIPLAVIFAGIGMATIVALPLSMIAALVGAVASLVKRDSGPLALGALFMTGAFGAALLLGVGLRIFNEVGSAILC